MNHTRSCDLSQIPISRRGFLRLLGVGEFASALQLDVVSWFVPSLLVDASDVAPAETRGADAQTVLDDERYYAPNFEVDTPLIDIKSADHDGHFGRVRAIDDDSRLVLTYPADNSSGLLSGRLQVAKAKYGLDFKTFGFIQGADDTERLREMQQLFENSPYQYLGFYLGRASSHIDTSWMDKAARLLDEGWALVPVYVGRQQDGAQTEDPNNPPAHITAGVEDQQGTTDGQNAVDLAVQATLPNGCTIYLDIEAENKAGHPNFLDDATLTYIDNWRDAVMAGGFDFGIYCSAGVSNQLQARYQPANLWVSRFWYTEPFDQNADWRQVGMDVPLNPRTPPSWDFIGWPNTYLWQWLGDWPGPTIPRYVDSGDRRDWRLPGGGVDFNLSAVTDPGLTSGGLTKTERRRKVAQVQVAATAVPGGTGTQLTITLDRPAPPPDGLLIMLRTSAPEVLIPNSVRVPASSNTATVQVATVRVNATTVSTISARGLHQLTDPAATVDVKIMS